MFRRLSLFGLVLGGALLLGGVSWAANKADRCRARTYEQFQACKLRQIEEAKTLTQQRSFRRSRSTASGELLERTSTTTRRVSTSRRRFSSSDSIQTGRTVTNTVRDGLDTYETVSAQNIDFAIALPQSFRKTADTLEWDNGAMIFRRGLTERISVQATSNRCEGGATMFRNCLSEAVQDAYKEISKFNAGMVQVTNKEKFWGRRNVLDPSQIGRSSSGRYALWENTRKRIGIFFFFDPEQGGLWKVEFESPAGSRTLLADEETVDKVLYSLFAVEDESRARAQDLRDRKAIITSSTRSIATRNVRRPIRARVDGTTSREITAANIPFRMSVPQEFQVFSDTLERTTGSMILMAGEERVIIIEPSDKRCADATPRIVRRCVEDAAESFLKANNVYKTSSLLQKRNFNLSLQESSETDLLRNTSLSTELGTFHLFRTSDTRKAQLVFREPVSHNLWVFRIEVPEEKRGLLNEIREIQRLISSLFFPPN